MIEAAVYSRTCDVSTLAAPAECEQKYKIQNNRDSVGDILPSLSLQAILPGLHTKYCHRSIDTHARQLLCFLRENPRLVVIGGAGLSAESGIPTYRDSSGAWQRSDPIQHADFLTDPAQQRRYWARSFLGWPLVRDARPNSAHHALCRLEQLGRLELLITQNVDGLHQSAGSGNVVDLHGRVDRVVCLDCEQVTGREAMQQRIAAANPRLVPQLAGWLPDGDADLPEDQLVGFELPRCESCGGALMPDVVFFGGTVPASRVRAGMEAISRADALLAVGSSLQVFSGFRFCRHAAALGKPLALINPGVTRADELACLKLPVACGSLLAEAIELLEPLAPEQR
jgi:NAD-dependent SIR2 family protein deacetylase